MNRVAKRLPGGFVHRFAQSRMRVNRRFDFFVSRFQRHRQTKLGNHLGRFRPDDMRAENFAVRFADDQLNKTIGLADGARFATRAERKLSDLEFQTGLFRGALR